MACFRPGGARDRRPQYARCDRHARRATPESASADGAHCAHRQGQGRELRREHLRLAQQFGERRNLRQVACRIGGTMNAPEIAPAEWRTRSANQTRLAFGQALLEIVVRELRAVVVSADTQDLLGIRAYIERFRDRFIELGIAEQNAIGAASGLATTGLRPYVCAYAPFITARSMEQVRNDVAYANQRVVIGAAASGISLGVAGGTHHALEDLALMRSLPNMTVIVPADVDEAYKAALCTLDIDGPVYLRLGGRAEEPPVSDPDAPFRLGRAAELRAGKPVRVNPC